MGRNFVVGCFSLFFRTKSGSTNNCCNDSNDMSYSILFSRASIDLKNFQKVVPVSRKTGQVMILKIFMRIKRAIRLTIAFL